MKADNILKRIRYLERAGNGRRAPDLEGEYRRRAKAIGNQIKKIRRPALERRASPAGVTLEAGALEAALESAPAERRMHDHPAPPCPAPAHQQGDSLWN